MTNMTKLLALLLLSTTGCSTMRSTFWDCYGCIGSMTNHVPGSTDFRARNAAMYAQAKANSPEMAKAMEEAPSDPSDIWYTLDLHKAPSYWWSE